MEKIKNYIGGEFKEPTQGKYLDNWDPAVGAVYNQVPDSSSADVELAVASAKTAFESWKAVSSEHRADVLRKIASFLCENSQRLSEAESRDVGKPLRLAQTVDIPRAVRSFEFFADAISQMETSACITDAPAKALNYTLRQPHGVVALITPWNLPLYLLTWKVAPALATGNCVVAKPSEVTPMTAYLLAEICHKAGLPPGVLNIVQGTGTGVGESMINHPDVKAVSFTGSTVTGKKIAEACAKNLKKVSLELGGKNPNIIFADCNWEKTLDTTVRAAFSNSGQICLCGSRVFVEDSIYDKFKKALVEKIQKIRVGDPQDASTEMGSMVSRPHFEKVMSYLKIAKSEGAKILIGGDRFKAQGRCENGWFIQPTLIEGLNNKCQTNQEEIFGPVATLQPFATEDEVIKLANDIPYGLSASIWTQDVSKAHRVSSRLDSGVVWVNSWMIRDLRTPFGGMKQSGIGREGGQEALRFFTEPKNVCVAYE